MDDKLFAFESLYLDIINEQAPIKKFHARGNQVPFHVGTMAQIHPTQKQAVEKVHT